MFSCTDKNMHVHVLQMCVCVCARAYLCVYKYAYVQADLPSVSQYHHLLHSSPEERIKSFGQETRDPEMVVYRIRETRSIKSVRSSGGLHMPLLVVTTSTGQI